MTATQSYNLKRFVAVAIAFILATGLFAFFYGKQYAEELNKQAMAIMQQKRDKENKEAEERIRQRDLAIAQADGRNAELQKQLLKKEKEYAYIGRKYDRKVDSVTTLPLDAKVQFLSVWLSEADSTQWRYVSSNN